MGGRRDDAWHSGARPYCMNILTPNIMAAIVVKLRPKFNELRANETYSYEQVIDILCEFAQSLYPDIAPERIREIIVENF
jgi:hypothetical protein